MGLDTELQYDEAFAKQVFRAFLREGIIIVMPAQLKKRKVLLDYMAEDFEKGRSYTEQEVNFKILDHYDDFCTVRREMITLGLLQRAAKERFALLRSPAASAYALYSGRV